MYDKDDCCCCRRKEMPCTEKFIIATLAIVFAFVIGIIVGATTDLFATIGTAAFIVIAVVLGVLLLLKLAIYTFCGKREC